MGRLEKLYDKSPIFFQNIMVSVKGFLNNRQRYGKAYYKHLEFLKEFDQWSLKKQEKYQEEELLKLIYYAVDKSPFYKNLYQDIDLSQIKSVNDLKVLPIVTKEMLRQNSDDVMTIPKKGCVESHTGGTTGKSLVVRMRKDDMMRRMAELDYFKSKVGFYHLKMKRATFNGKHIIPRNQKKKVFWRYNMPCKQMLFTSTLLTEENIAYYIEELNKFKPQAIDGFFSPICDIANYIERKQISLSFIPIAIFPTSETLTIEGRELIERVFKCKVYDQYASSEGAPFITECKSQVLHINLNSGVIEHFEEGSDEVLVTSFTTYGTPLIRLSNW